MSGTRARGRPRMRWMDEENEVEQTMRMDCVVSGTRARGRP